MAYLQELGDCVCQLLQPRHSSILYEMTMSGSVCLPAAEDSSSLITCTPSPGAACVDCPARTLPAEVTDLGRRPRAVDRTKRAAHELE